MHQIARQLYRLFHRRLDPRLATYVLANSPFARSLKCGKPRSLSIIQTLTEASPAKGAYSGISHSGFHYSWPTRMMSTHRLVRKVRSTVHICQECCVGQHLRNPLSPVSEALILSDGGALLPSCGARSFRTACSSFAESSPNPLRVRASSCTIGLAAAALLRTGPPPSRLPHLLFCQGWSRYTPSYS